MIRQIIAIRMERPRQIEFRSLPLKYSHAFCVWLLQCEDGHEARTTAYVCPPAL